MRPWFAFLLILTLTLRGLLGNAMAMQMDTAHCGGPLPVASHMAANHTDAANGHTQHGLNTGSTLHTVGPEAPGQQTHQAAAAPDAAAQCDAHQHEAGCAACGICHSTAAFDAWLSPTLAATPSASHADLTSRFASALAAPAIKPPIF